ncbi:MAG TPA: hypothetical protein VK928_02480, partial [Longimicrobiales bacterium]|nr:hypothetical protein [Longimicrobiales bacterium]
MFRPATARAVVLVASTAVLSGCIERELPTTPPATQSTVGIAPLYTVDNAAPDRYIVVYRDDLPGAAPSAEQFRAEVEQELS